jgi:hypothetical protein
LGTASLREPALHTLACLQHLTYSACLLTLLRRGGGRRWHGRLETHWVEDAEILMLLTACRASSGGFCEVGGGPGRMRERKRYEEKRQKHGTAWRPSCLWEVLWGTLLGRLDRKE